MLAITHYQKRYNGSLVLSINELNLDPGLYWIKGENGSGKSTLFKSIAGLIPFEGQITLNDLDIRKHQVQFRSIVNYAEAEPFYPGFATAKDLIHFIARTKKATRSNQEFITTHFGVDQFFEKPCETFSSGMMKKLSLTLAFLGTPRLIILDEPLITLDEQTRFKLNDLVLQMHKEGVSFLISSHQLIESNLPLAATFEIKDKTIQRVFY